VGRKGAHDISTCKSVVKRTQEDDDSALCSHSHPHFNNSDMFACFINSRTLSSHARSLLRSMLSHLLEYCLFFTRRTRCRSVGRVGSFGVGIVVVRTRKEDDELGRTVDDIVRGPLRQIQAGRQRIVCCVELTALLDNGSFA